MASTERERTNAILRQHGYRWEEEEIGSEDDWAGPGSLLGGTGEVVGFRWVLIAPDGVSQVGVSEALQQIETGTIPTREAWEAKQAARRAKHQALVAGGAIVRMEKVADYLHEQCPSLPGKAAAKAAGWPWTDLTQWDLEQLMERLGKWPLFYSEMVDLDNPATILHEADLPAVASAWQQMENERAARYQGWLEQKEESERRQADRTPRWKAEAHGVGSRALAYYLGVTCAGQIEYADGFGYTAYRDGHALETFATVEEAQACVEEHVRQEPPTEWQDDEALGSLFAGMAELT